MTYSRRPHSVNAALSIEGRAQYVTMFVITLMTRKSQNQQLQVLDIVQCIPAS